MGETLYCFSILTSAGTTMIVLSTGDKSIVIRMLKGQLAAQIRDGNKAHGQTDRPRYDIITINKTFPYCSIQKTNLASKQKKKVYYLLVNTLFATFAGKDVISSCNPDVCASTKLCWIALSAELIN